MMEATGIWRIKTENSVYYIDWNAGDTGITVGLRIPDDITTNFAALRRDGQTFWIHEVIEPIQVGRPLRMIITVEKGVVTERTTSPVLSIVGIKREHEVFVAGDVDLSIWDRMLDEYHGD